MNKKDQNRYFTIGSILVSGTTGFRAFISPDQTLVPETVPFQIYEKLEAVLHDPSVDRAMYDEIVRVVDYLELLPRQELLVLGEKQGRGVQIYILSEPNGHPIKLVEMTMETHRVVAPQSSQSEVVTSPSNQSISKPTPKEDDNTYDHLLAGFEVEAILSALPINTEVVIGRASESRYLSTIGLVSRKHIHVKRLARDEFLISDLGSTNGSEISFDGKDWGAITEARKYKGGDFLRLGGVSSRVIARLPRLPTPYTLAQATLARLLGQVKSNDELILGSNNSNLTELLHFVSNIPGELLRITRPKKKEYQVEPLSFDVRVLYHQWGSEDWVPLNEAVRLLPGSILQISDNEPSIRLPIVTPLHQIILKLPLRTEFEIGRSVKDLDLADFSAISRNHAIIFKLLDGSIVVRDLQSTNGTRVREEHGPWHVVQEPVRVCPGSEVLFGSEAQGLLMVVP